MILRYDFRINAHNFEQMQKPRYTVDTNLISISISFE